jgi:hypothetical protein
MVLASSTGTPTIFGFDETGKTTGSYTTSPMVRVRVSPRLRDCATGYRDGPGKVIDQPGGDVGIVNGSFPMRFA